MNEQILAQLYGARALIDQALSAMANGGAECDHPAESADDLPSNGLPEQKFRCGLCGTTFTRPWPED